MGTKTEIVDAETKLKLEKSVSGYRSMAEFTDFQLVSKEQQFGVNLNKIDKANEKTQSRTPDPHYEGNSYHIALRPGEFSAQKDKTMAKVYQFFLDYGPEVDVISHDKDFYIASRTIKDLVHGFSDYEIASNGDVFLKAQDQPQCPLKVIGLGGICALTYFFGESDVHSKNWGMQLMRGKLIAYKIDNANSLEVECLDSPITLAELEALPNIDEKLNAEIYMHMLAIPKEIVASESFQREKWEMLKKIAATDFRVIKNMLASDITTTQAADGLAFLRKFTPLLEKGPGYLSTTFQKPLDECKNFLEGIQKSLDDPSGIKEAEKMDVYTILALLEKRHTTLRTLLGFEKGVSFLPQFQALTPPETFSPSTPSPLQSINLEIWHV